MWSSSVTNALLAALCLCPSVYGYLYVPQDFVDTNDDLESFISRPDIRPPKFKVTARDSHASASPGYFFLAPYADLVHRAPSTMFTQGQTGPHIYDFQGNLIWSGANLFGQRPTFDFKASNCNGQPCFTFIVHQDMSSKNFSGGAGVIMDTSFNIRDSIESTTGRGTMNMHEFTVTEQGTAMYITYASTMSDVGQSKMFVGDNGFREVDIRTGKAVFDWWALDHVNPVESLRPRPTGPGSYSGSWDFFHMNSIDKNADGDYLISSRYLNAIYKISGKDGSIIWQLGGRKSSFDLQDFKFSSQHHARFVEESASHAVISFLNNAADDRTATARSSSAMYVRMDLKNMSAALDKKFNRPDQGLTKLRGNVQRLPNDNTLVSWSENGLISEFDSKGNCLFEGEFASHRFVTYRAYKFNFTGTPSESPQLVAQVYSSSPNNTVTAMYVSWNGATEVSSWRFLASDRDQDRLISLGEVKKEGFETSLMVSGWQENILAEALAADGTVLGSSSIVRAVAQPGVVLSAPAHHKSTDESSSKKHPHHVNDADADADVVHKTSSQQSKGDKAELRNFGLENIASESVRYLIILLTMTCIALFSGLAVALYKIRVLTRSIALGGSYLPVRSVSLH